MDKKNIKISTEYIKLDSFLKLSEIAVTGAEAKMRIQAGEVLVNNEKELRRGRKIYRSDIVQVGDVVLNVY